jgi:nucleoside-diphosphate-sugar epimerase
MKALFFGADGWIGSYFVKELEKVGFEVVATSARADNPNDVEAVLESTLPDRVVSFIGRTHGEGFNCSRIF